MKKIAFIDHTYHQKTIAFEFLKIILRKKYIVDEYWDASWEGGEGVTAQDLNKKDYDCIFFGQIFPTKTLIKELRCKNIVWMPMYDSEVNSGLLRITKLFNLGVKILSFSKYQHDKYLKLGFDSTYLQFFSKPEEKLTNLKNKKTVVYYWPRIDAISWAVVKKILGENFKGKVVILNTPDPKNTFIMPTAEDVKKYHIKFTGGTWITREQAIKERVKADIFIAPRLYEGIGMGFLEAMAGGCAVVSPDNPTMNEYIVNNKTGYLYDINNVQTIDFTNLKKVKANTYSYVKKGYKTWEKTSDKRVHALIETPYHSNMNVVKYVYLLSNAVSHKVMKLIKKYF